MSDSYNQPPYGRYQGQPQNQGYGYEQHNQPAYGQQQQQQYGNEVAPYGQEPSQYGQQDHQNQQQYSQQQQYDQQQQHQYPPNTEQSANGDRGIGGAITGGLAGGFGGHKAGHGFLGTIGGAILGSFAEDKLKKHKEDKKENQHRPHSGQGGHNVGFSESHSESFSFGGKK